MTADFPAVLDACVLVQAPLRDTLLRLAEPPRLYIPQWSDEIIAETVRTLENRIGLSAQKTEYLVGPEAEVRGDHRFQSQPAGLSEPGLRRSPELTQPCSPKVTQAF